MINKQEAKAKGMRIIAPNEKAKEEREHKLNQLKALMPSLVNSDGKVDVQALEDFIEPNNLASREQGHQLTFAGKGLARAIADVSTKKEFRLEKGQSKNFDKTENVIVRGDNLDALKLLRQNYSNKVKMIYIDPPYNTGGDGFTYKNNFQQSIEGLVEHLELREEILNYLTNMYGTQNHSGWLSFMYPRIQLARDLLTDDGFIFITIDHFELNNLISIVDEIFGEENRLGIVTIMHNPKGRNLAKFFSENSEFMIVYAKNKDISSFENVSITDKNTKTFNLEDDGGKYRLDPFMRARHDSTREAKPKFFYPLYVSPDLQKISTRNINNYYEVFPVNNKNKAYSWKTLPKTFNERNTLGEYVAKKENGNIVIYNKHREQEVIKNVWVEKKYQSEFHGTNIVKNLFGKNVFSYPKSLYAVKDTLKLSTKRNDIILDFFAGSGTTAEAVMSLNKEDGGNRKFILVQWDEAIPKKTPGYDFCTEHNLAPVISSICIERVNRAGEKIKAEASKQKNLLEDDKKLPDTGYRVFSLTDRPELDGKQLQLNINRNTALDTLYNMMAISGEALLTDEIEEIEKDKLYKVNNAYYLLGDCKTNLKKADSVFVDGYADISLNKWLNTLGLNKDKVSILY